MNNISQTESTPFKPQTRRLRSASVSRLLLPALLVFSLALPTAAQASLKIYYLRHAEYGGNVVRQWRDKPKDQWPDYVGRGDMFTPKGKEQVEALTGKLLKNHHFDFIAVSPAWRTRNTIAPYLKATNQTAEIWPALQEFGNLSHQHDANLPPPSPTLFTGKPVTLAPEDKGLFTLRDDNLTSFKISSDPLQAAADRRAVVEKDIEMIRHRFAGTDKTILLVGHGNSGRILAEALTHEPKAFEKEPPNTAMWMAEEQPDGTFKLRMLNDEPFKSPTTQPTPTAR